MWSKRAGRLGTPARVVEEAVAARAQRPAKVANRASMKMQALAQLRAVWRGKAKCGYPEFVAMDRREDEREVSGGMV